MPPRKSDVSKVATGDEAIPAKEQVGINIEDLNLPKSIVTRLAKGVLPPNTQIQGNAMLAMTKSATVFVNYLAAQANEHAGASNRKTVTPQDVLNALDDLEFGDFKPRLEAELAKYNEMQTDKRNAAKNKHADAKAGKNGGVGGEIEMDGQDRDGQPASKKARLDPDESMGIDRSGLPEGDHTADEDVGEDDGREDEPEDDEEEDEEEADQEERLEAEEAEEELEKEVADEALDNGEDSD